MLQMVKRAYFSEWFDILSTTTTTTTKSGVFTKARGGVRGTIFKLLGILPKITDGTNGERCILFRMVWLTFNNNKKKEKKSGVFTNAGSGVRGIIFKHLGILPKIKDGTNGETCILFSRF